MLKQLIHNTLSAVEHCLTRQRPIEFVLTAQLARPCAIRANAHRIQVNVPESLRLLSSSAVEQNPDQAKVIAMNCSQNLLFVPEPGSDRMWRTIMTS
jgi:hypothetical protein